MTELIYRFQKFLRKYVWALKMNFQKGKIVKIRYYHTKKEKKKEFIKNK